MGGQPEERVGIGSRREDWRVGERVGTSKHQCALGPTPTLDLNCKYGVESGWGDESGMVSPLRFSKTSRKEL